MSDPLKDKMLSALENDPEYKQQVSDDHDRLAEAGITFDDATVECNLDGFNYELSNLYDLCDDYRVWVKLNAGDT